MAKRIFLTGGGGFIGRNLLESDLATRYDWVAPRSRELNLADSEAVNRFFAEYGPFDAVVHGAVKPGHRNALDRQALMETNLRFFENLVANRRHFDRLINLGSGAIYDTSRDICLAREDNAFDRVPADEHGLTKYVMGQRLRTLDNAFDLYLFGVFGPYEDFAIRFISNALCKALCDLPITLRRNRRFSYLDVADFAPILAYFIDGNPPHRTYNVVPSHTVTLLDMAHAVQSSTGGTVPVQVAEPGMGLEYTGNNDRLMSEGQPFSFTTPTQSIARLHQWYAERMDKLDRTVLITDR